MTLKQTVDEIKTALVEDGVMMIDRDAALMAAYQLGAKDGQHLKAVAPDPAKSKEFAKVTAKAKGKK